MKAYQLLDILNSEANNVYSFRTYLDSTDARVMLIDMHYPDDVNRMADYLRANTELSVTIIHATPLGAPARRRIVVKGLEQKR
jgi:hypothetical protein